MSNDIARLRPAELPTAQPANANLSTVVEGIMAQLKDAIGQMRADDVSVELTADQHGHRSHAHFAFRAYRKGRQIAGEDRDV